MKIYSLIKSLLLLVVLIQATLSLNHAGASELYFIDVHSQLDHTIDDPSMVIQRMDEYGVYRTILAARSKR
jgi:hypothetical protein